MLKIYGVLISVHTRKVILAGKEKGIVYENEGGDPLHAAARLGRAQPDRQDPGGDRRRSAFAQFVGDLRLSGTDPAEPRRSIPRRRATTWQALWFEEFADGTIFREVVHGLFFQKVIRPGILKQDTDQAVIGGILNGMRCRSISVIWKRHSGGRPILPGRGSALLTSPRCRTSSTTTISAIVWRRRNSQGSHAISVVPVWSGRRSARRWPRSSRWPMAWASTAASSGNCRQV